MAGPGAQSGRQGMKRRHPHPEIAIVGQQRQQHRLQFQAWPQRSVILARSGLLEQAGAEHTQSSEGERQSPVGGGVPALVTLHQGVVAQPALKGLPVTG